MNKEYLQHGSWLAPVASYLYMAGDGDHSKNLNMALWVAGWACMAYTWKYGKGVSPLTAMLCLPLGILTYWLGDSKAIENAGMLMMVYGAIPFFCALVSMDNGEEPRVDGRDAF